MPIAIKITVAAVCGLLGLVSIGLVGLRDMAQRPTFCAACHIVQPYVETWADSNHLAHTHKQLGIPCQSCHARTIGALVSEVVSTVRQTYDDPLSEIKVPQGDCFRCHGDYETLAERTKDLIQNPHDSHWGALDCGVCHKMHKDSIDYCAQCHDPTVDKPGWTLPPRQQ